MIRYKTLLAAIVALAVVSICAPLQINAGIADPPTTVLSVTVGPPSDGVDAVQNLEFGAGITGGTFRLKFGTQITGAIAWSSDSAVLEAHIQNALRALPAIGAGGVTVADGDTIMSGIGDVLVTYEGARTAKLAVPTLTVYSNSLTGTTHVITITVETAGVTADGRLFKAGTLCLDKSGPLLWVNTADGPNVAWQAYPSVTAAPQVLFYDISANSVTDSHSGVRIIEAYNDSGDVHDVHTLDAGDVTVAAGQQSLSLVIPAVGIFVIHNDGV